MFDEAEFELSPLSQDIARHGRTVSVEIYRLEGFDEWSLEVIDVFDNSTTWGESFKTEQAALDVIKAKILTDGIDSLIGPEDGDGKSEGDQVDIRHIKARNT